MTREWINAQEGEVVYGTYRPAGTVSAQSGERGIVYQGIFYTVKVGGDHKNDPTVYLTPISETAMIDICRIEESNRGDLENALALCLAQRHESLDGQALDLGMAVLLEVKKK